MNRANQGMGQKKRKQNKMTEFTVSERSGLLDFLLLKLSDKSRNNVKSLLTHEEVLIDGKIITKHDYILKAGMLD